MTLVAVGVWGDVYQLVDSSRWYQTLGPIQTQNSKGIQREMIGEAKERRRICKDGVRVWVVQLSKEGQGHKLDFKT